MSRWKTITWTNDDPFHWHILDIHIPNIIVLTHWSQDKMATISQMTFLNAFYWMYHIGICPTLWGLGDFSTLRPRQNGQWAISNCIFRNENVWISIKISLKFVPKGLINNNPALVHIVACCLDSTKLLLYPHPTKLEGGYTGFTLSVRLSVCPSVRLSVCPSVCRRHGFRSISQVCFGISISNFICMLMVAIGRSLLIFSDVTFKMAAWRPYWIFWFPDSNLTLALNINFKLQRHNTYVYG